MLAEDLPEGKFKTAAEKFKKMADNMDSLFIKVGDIGLEESNPSHVEFFGHLRYLYG